MKLEFHFEEERKRFISLQGLVNKNGGNFKSHKQAKFIRTWASNRDTEDLKDYFFFTDEDVPKEGEYVIEIDAYFYYGNYGVRGLRPVTYFYIMDAYGVARKYRIRYEGNMRDGTAPKSCELEWERTTVTYEPEPSEIAALKSKETDVKAPEPKPEPEETKEEPVSEWVGTVGKRQQFTATLVFSKWIDTAYGSSLLMIFKTEKGNVLKTFYKGYSDDILDMEDGETYTFNAGVKEHSEYNGEKQTMIQRITKVKNVKVPV
jgi:hypothetical protein